MKQILVIDDERDVLELVRSILRTKGYKVRCAEGGEEGLRQAEEEIPDLIVCDLMMPRISGMEVVKRLRRSERLRQIPVIILSAVGADSDKPAEYWAQGLGVDEYIPKPFDPMDLLGRVEFIFRRNQYKSMGGTPLPVADEAGSTRTPSESGTYTPPPVKPTRIEVDLQNASPAEIAQAYVAAWNLRDWTTEYECMDPAIMAHYPLSQYKERRTEAWAEERRDQKLDDILDESIKGAEATVRAMREDSMNGAKSSRMLTFSLKKTEGGWKIIRFREG